MKKMKMFRHRLYIHEEAKWMDKCANKKIKDKRYKKLSEIKQREIENESSSL